MDVTETVDAYVAAWNEQDTTKRTALLAGALSEDVSYRDPLYSVLGRGALVDHIGGYQGRFPDATMERRSAVDAHHDVLRFAWAIVGPDGNPTLQGVDFVALNSEGRIAAVTGFFGDLA